MKKLMPLTGALTAALLWIAAVQAAPLTLVGETHGNQEQKTYELDLWRQMYDRGSRDLILELGEAHALWLKRWMRADNDNLLDELFTSVRGTLEDSQPTREFFLEIKRHCPQTRFWGVDVNHQYATIGEWAVTRPLNLPPEEIESLKKNNEQGQVYTRLKIEGDAPQATEYREEQLTNNLLALPALKEKTPILGIFGSDHLFNTGRTSGGCMARRLEGKVADGLKLIDARRETAKAEPQSFALFGRTVQGLVFPPSEFHIPGISEVLGTDRRFIRLEIEGDLPDLTPSGDHLTAVNFPFAPEPGELYLVEYRGSDLSYPMLYRVDPSGEQALGLLPNPQDDFGMVTLTVAGSTVKARNCGSAIAFSEQKPVIFTLLHADEALPDSLVRKGVSLPLEGKGWFARWQPLSEENATYTALNRVN